MIKLKDLLPELHSSEIYFGTMTAALTHARQKTEKKGFIIDDDSWWDVVSTGPRKPSAGKTNRYSIDLINPKAKAKPGDKRGKSKTLNIQIYGMKNSYELNWYIS